ncbi:MAG: class I SAM-dependent methyltransferase [Verrucomicrobia bacterium]|nr:class I SAM-dependent methyltransferase [Verrucomicrobiota bacterium]
MRSPLSDPRYVFSTAWFDAHVPAWDRVIGQLQPKRVLEIGSYEGKSACYLIERISSVDSLELHCVDTWEGSIENDPAGMPAVESRFDQNIGVAVSLSANPPTVLKHKVCSYLAMTRLIASGNAEGFDFIYIDGSHQAPDVLSDAVLAFHLLRIGGVLVFDDYLWHMEPVGRQDVLNMPRIAIDSFLNIHQRKMQVLVGFPIGQIYAVKTAR